MPRILLVKTTSMGDVIHNLAVASDIAACVEDAHIDWVVENSFAAIPKLHPAVERVIPVAIRQWRKRIYLPATWEKIRKSLQQIRQNKYDYIIDTQGLLKSALIASRARGSVYGLDRISVREPMASRFYDYKFQVPKNQHAVTRNRQLAAAVFGYDLAATPLDYGIEKTVQTSYSGGSSPDKTIVFLHGTSRESKLWEESNWTALGQKLGEQFTSIVLPWGNGTENKRAMRLSQQMDNATVAPRQGLKELATMLSHASCVVGVDTGPVHLAVALNLPTVAIYTDTDPALTGVLPMNPARAINLGGKNNSPTVDVVLQAVKELTLLG